MPRIYGYEEYALRDIKLALLSDSQISHKKLTVMTNTRHESDSCIHLLSLRVS